MYVYLLTYLLTIIVNEISYSVGRCIYRFLANVMQMRSCAVKHSNFAR